MAANFWRSSHYLEWLLDRQDVLKFRAVDLRILGSEEDYQKIMIFFADVIQAFGKSLEVRQQAIATATVYFKRFYGRTSLRSIDPWLMAPSCILLASKVEEFGVIAHKSLITACCKVVNSQYSKFFKDYNYPYRNNDINECEFILMEAMDCSLVVFLPYRPLLQFCEDIRTHLPTMVDELLDRAWGMVNDSFRCDVSLHYPPYLIALGCVQLALISLARNPPSPTTTQNDHHSYYTSQQPNLNPLAVSEHWFSELNVDPEKVLEVVRHLLALYDLWDRMNPDSEMPQLLQKIPCHVAQHPGTVKQMLPPMDASGSSGAANQHRMNQQMPPPPHSHHMGMPPPHHLPQTGGGPPMC